MKILSYMLWAVMTVMVFPLWAQEENEEAPPPPNANTHKKVGSIQTNSLNAPGNNGRHYNLAENSTQDPACVSLLNSTIYQGGALLTMVLDFEVYYDEIIQGTYRLPKGSMQPPYPSPFSRGLQEISSANGTVAYLTGTPITFEVSCFKDPIGTLPASLDYYPNDTPDVRPIVYTQHALFANVSTDPGVSPNLVSEYGLTSSQMANAIVAYDGSSNGVAEVSINLLTDYVDLVGKDVNYRRWSSQISIVLQFKAGTSDWTHPRMEGLWSIETGLIDYPNNSGWTYALPMFGPSPTPLQFYITNDEDCSNAGIETSRIATGSAQTDWLATPNPFGDVVNLSGSWAAGTPLSYQILDLTGKVVLQGRIERALPAGELQAFSVKLGTHHFPNGLYLVRLDQTEGKANLIRLIKQ